MSATLTYTRPPLLHRLRRAVRVALLQWEIKSAERWVKNLQRGGVAYECEIDAARRHVSDLTIELAIALDS